MDLGLTATTTTTHLPSVRLAAFSLWSSEQQQQQQQTFPLRDLQPSVHGPRDGDAFGVGTSGDDRLLQLVEESRPFELLDERLDCLLRPLVLGLALLEGHQLPDDRIRHCEKRIHDGVLWEWWRTVGVGRVMEGVVIEDCGSREGGGASGGGSGDEGVGDGEFKEGVAMDEVMRKGILRASQRD